MKQIRSYAIMLSALTVLMMASCSPSAKIKTTGVWANREKMPDEPIKSVFIIALTENMQIKEAIESDLAAAARAKGIKAFTSIDIMGPVGIKAIAPHKDVFDKKLAELGCETIFTVALVNKESETRYVPGSSVGVGVDAYAPYGYGSYGGYGGFAPYGAYGGFGGYYGYSVAVLSDPGYYTTSNTYFIDARLFDVKTEELLLAVQSKATNPDGIESSTKKYCDLLVKEINELNLRQK